MPRTRRVSSTQSAPALLLLFILVLLTLLLPATSVYATELPTGASADAALLPGSQRHDVRSGSGSGGTMMRIRRPKAPQFEWGPIHSVASVERED
ncbi:hypothetical protein A4X06_0g3664 [Tilletia controversa]|uniref:Uncharacterized protein n=2 Tax=Tilletia TaxID=13289 RepID=A0A8X7SXE3_9BASI|nr:hypothetical protein CF335_g6109 [Tilletia laevis]KAE8194639.1 hypothetical protein CF336_g3451 [Tilletia laevis]KAE8204492.1 hypothetical protein CF328_g1047 [Tilletia controversa]KAE8248509.1 hypothetical protein A4X06_0g3664 [Tilletia controversa]KAE8253383.1 hypothetical protein A4X03_0g5909 [Tilletia caries]